MSGGAPSSRPRSPLGAILLLTGVTLSLGAVLWLVAQMGSETRWDRVLAAGVLWVVGAACLLGSAWLLRTTAGPPT